MDCVYIGIRGLIDVGGSLWDMRALGIKDYSVLKDFVH